MKVNPNVAEIVAQCDKLVELYGLFPRNMELEEMQYHLGPEWGKMIHDWYVENPKSKLMVNNGRDMALPVVDAYIKWAESTQPPDPSQNATAS
jgi:hypothetical protein